MDEGILGGGADVVHTKLVEGVLRRVVTDAKMVIIAENWPCWLVSAIALRLPLLGAYFPVLYHGYFKPKNSVSTWMTVFDLLQTTVDCDAVYLISGNAAFIRKLAPWFSDVGFHRSIVVMERCSRGGTQSSRRASWREGLLVLRDFDLQSVSFVDSACGGATDAQHDIGFGSKISPLPRAEIGVSMCVRNFLDGGADTEGMVLKVVPRSSLKTIEQPRRVVLWENDILRPDGLFPTWNSEVMVFCPAHNRPKSWVVRQLTHYELRRLYQLPLAMEPAFESMRDGIIASRYKDHKWLLPYENSPSSGILTSVIRQLWGIVGGVEEEGKEEEANGREPSDSIMTVNRPDTLLDGEAARLAEVETEQKVQEEALGFKFDWNDGLPAWKGASPERLSDDGSGTSLASEETMRGSISSVIQGGINMILKPRWKWIPGRPSSIQAPPLP